MQDFLEISFSDLQQWLKRYGQKSFHARQIFTWVYERGVRDWSQMTDLSAELRSLLKQNFHLLLLKERSLRRFSDEEQVHIQYLLRDGQLIGTRRCRKELHIASQVGCAATHCFLPLGVNKWKRQLRASEIVEQVLLTTSRFGKASHLCFDEAGEPLANLRGVLGALSILCDQKRGGYAPSCLHITTVGLLQGIEALLPLGMPIPLAIALHAPTQSLRQKLIPAARKNRLAELLPLLGLYSHKTGLPITFLYCLIQGVNDSVKEAVELARLLCKMRARVLLTPLPARHAKSFSPSPKKNIKAFRSVLYSNKIKIV